MSQVFPAHWDVLPFSLAVKDATSEYSKLQKSEYLEQGRFPIVDQGQQKFGGYTDDESVVSLDGCPAIVFGDHTRIFKFIDEPFCLGADGAKVLEPKAELDKKFLFYYLSSLNIESAGYSRHFKFLKENVVPVPPLPEQKRIAAILDKADAIRRKRQQAIQLADDFLRAVFLDMFGDVIEGAENVVRFSDVAVLDAPMVDPRVDEYIDLIHIGPDRIEKKIGKLLPALTAREEGLISKKFLFDDRYVLYSKIRPYLRKCAMAEGVGLCSADMYPVRPVEGVA
ncbi:TPA: restriction endonuclease subunit S, partial [Pseudomonas aeruginosa]